MRVLVEGSGGDAGWPQPGCRCASCLRQAAAGSARKGSAIVVDGRVRLSADGRVASAAGYRVRRVADARAGGPGGWDVTAPDGGRLLYPAGAGGIGAAPAPPEGTAPYDVAFLDLLGDPAQLGWLRARGLITAGTVAAVAYADHRVPSEAELARRCGFWRVRLAGDGEAIDPARSVPKDRDFPGGTRRVLVLGGARSGKSERAELRLAGEPEVTYVATGNRGTGDPDWAARVAAHRARRPAWWATAETTDLAGLLGANSGADHGTGPGALLIDGIGTWLAAVLEECGWDPRDGAARETVAARIAGLTGAWRQACGYVVAVSDETGLGVVPASAAGRLFRDELGRLNQALAAESEEAELVVAGRVLPLGEW
ncbi:MAG TPA: bifunctional adenosylcobinamide kinase/adenosylcobinamide-phosphate guanylyltransferase [Streptosporangiaceae bacterium]|nr:bifunctional adenosylcobinamide kinase/adenosylcobinamide-phosphate guanylyltransferase [Streptosporangiaceae bacterium]